LVFTDGKTILWKLALWHIVLNLAKPIGLSTLFHTLCRTCRTISKEYLLTLN
jgi:hypothetical protein